MEEMVMQQQLALPATYCQQMTPMVAQKVQNLKATIDIHDRNKVIAYGQEEQASIGKFYDSILQGTQTKELGEASELLTQVIGEINGYRAACDKEDKGFFAFFKKQKAKLQTLQTKYKTLADNIDDVVKQLRKKDIALGQVSRQFDIMYEENRNLYNFLTMVIFAGEQVLEDERNKLTIMQQNAKVSGDLMEVQKVADYNEDILRFERRLYDLKLSRTIAIQQAPQIRNIQKSADEVSESIRATIATAIPLWKSQMAIALGMQAVRDGLNAVNAVRESTNAMLIANSEMNKKLTLETAQAAERGVVNIETINAVNQNLIESLNGSFEIAKRATTSRKEGAKKLQESEAELKAAIVKYTNVN